MKKFLFVVFVIFFPLSVVSAKEQKVKKDHPFWRGLRNVVAEVAPDVEFPAIKNVLGIDLRASVRGVEVLANNMVVRNGVIGPYLADVFVYGKFIGRLGPGDLAFDNRRSELHWPQIPIFAIIRRDVDGEVVGMAARTFGISGEYPSSFVWTIQTGDVVTPDGRRLVLGTEAPTTALARTKVKFPKKWWGSAAGVQIGNCSFSETLVVSVNGNRTLAIPPGRMGYIEDTLIPGYGYGLNRIIQASWVRDKALLGTADYSFVVPGNGYGIYAYQIIATPGMRRY